MHVAERIHYDNNSVEDFQPNNSEWVDWILQLAFKMTPIGCTKYFFWNERLRMNFCVYFRTFIEPFYRNYTPMNANTLELDKILYGYDDEYEELTNVGSCNHHEVIEYKPKSVTSSCKQIELQYAPAKIAPDENFVEDEEVIELTPTEDPENSPSSSKESFIQLYIFPVLLHNEFINKTHKSSIPSSEIMLWGRSNVLVRQELTIRFLKKVFPIDCNSIPKLAARLQFDCNRL